MSFRLIACGIVLLIAYALIALGVPELAPSADSQLSWRQQAIIKERGRTHGCQVRLGMRRSPIAERVVRGGPPYRAWVLALWRQRTALCREIERKLSEPRAAILAVWGPKYGPDAVAVAACESHLSIYARNGRYEGLFQVSDHWRRTVPGFGYTALAQARHAFRVFKLTGSTWAHWECKP